MVKYVITGCAGSGTKWASRLMTTLGSPCTHQKVFRVLGVRPANPRWEGDSSFFAVGQTPPDLPVMQLVRNPLHVVRSLEQMSRFLTTATADDALTYQYIGRNNPYVLEADDRLGRILRYVATWDQINADLLLLVDRDRGESIITAYKYLTGRAPVIHPDYALAQLGNRTNTHNGEQSKLTWHDIRNHPDGQPVIDKAHRHGYETDD